jgi:hypothetical protein
VGVPGCTGDIAPFIGQAAESAETNNAALVTNDMGKQLAQAKHGRHRYNMQAIYQT